MLDTITATNPVIMADADALTDRTAVGYPITWDMTLVDGASKDAAAARMRNLSQLLHEQQRAGFVMLQGIPERNPERQTFLDGLKAELKKPGVNWAIAGDPSDKTVFTLFNTKLYKLEANQPKADDLPDGLSDKTTEKTRAFHYFKAIKDNQKQLVANMAYKTDATAAEVLADQKKIDDEDDEYAMIYAGQLGDLSTARAPNTHKIHSVAPHRSAMIIDAAILCNPGHTVKSDYNSRKSAAPRADRWDNEDINTVLAKSEGKKALRLDWITQTNVTVKPEFSNTDNSLRSFAPSFSSSNLSNESEGQDYMKKLLKELVATFKRTYHGASAAAENMPPRIRVAIPIAWQSAAGAPEHFTPLCIDVELKQAEFAALVNNETEVTPETFRACVQAATVIHPETARSKNLTDDKKTTLKTLLNQSFKPTADGAADIDITTPTSSILQFSRDGRSAGNDCGPLTAMTAQHFLKHGDVKISKVPVPADIDEWPDLGQFNNTDVWSEELQKRYAEESARYMAEQRRLFMVKLGAGKAPGSTAQPDRTESDSATTKAQLMNQKMTANRHRQMTTAAEKIFTTDKLEIVGNTVCTNQHGETRPILQISSSKDGKTTTLSAYAYPKTPRSDESQRYFPNGIELVRASLAFWLKKGVNKIKVESKNHMQLWRTEAEKVGITVKFDQVNAPEPPKSAGIPGMPAGIESLLGNS